MLAFTFHHLTWLKTGVALAAPVAPVAPALLYNVCTLVWHAWKSTLQALENGQSRSCWAQNYRNARNSCRYKIMHFSQFWESERIMWYLFIHFGSNISLAQGFQNQTRRVAALCSVAANSGSLFIAKRGVKFPRTCTSCRLWLLHK